MTSTPEEIRHLMDEAQRGPLVHYRRTQAAPVPCGAAATVAEPITTTPDPDMVTCETCQCEAEDDRPRLRGPSDEGTGASNADAIILPHP